MSAIGCETKVHVGCALLKLLQVPGLPLVKAKEQHQLSHNLDDLRFRTGGRSWPL